MVEINPLHPTVFRDGTIVVGTNQLSIDSLERKRFWCNNCVVWTRVEPYTEGEIELLLFEDYADVTPTCSQCGEGYQCGGCGHEINQHGDCLREEGCGE